MVEPGEYVNGGALAGQVEIGKRFVQHEHLGIRDQRLRDGDPLSQTSRKLGQPVFHLVLHPDEFQSVMDFVPLFTGGAMNPERDSCQAEQHGLLGGDVRFDVGCVTLRHISDVVVHDAGWPAEHGDGAMRDRDQPEFRLHHGGLSRSIGADDGGHRTLGYAKRAVLPDNTSAPFDAGVGEFDAGGCLVAHGFLLIDSDGLIVPSGVDNHSQ